MSEDITCPRQPDKEGNSLPFLDCVDCNNFGKCKRVWSDGKLELSESKEIVNDKKRI